MNTKPRISTHEKNLLEVRQWCEEKYKNQPIYKRRLPRKRINGVVSSKNRELETEEQREIRLGTTIESFRKSDIYKKGVTGGQLNESEERIYKQYKELEREYRINPYEANILEAKEWCEEKFKNSDIKDRRIPRYDIKGVTAVPKGKKETEEQKELRLGTSLYNFKRSNIFEKVQRKEKLTEDEQRIFEEYKDLIEQYEIQKNKNIKIEKVNRNIEKNELKEMCEHEIVQTRLQKLYSNILKVRKWCEEKYKNQPIYKRRFPRKGIKGVACSKNRELETEEQKEIRLGMIIERFRKSTIYKKGVSGETLNEIEQKIYVEYKELEREYRIDPNEANILEVKEWCEEKYKKQPIYKRRFPRKRIKGVTCSKNRELETEEQKEVRLGMIIESFRKSAIYKNGISGETLNESEKRIYKQYKELEREYRINPYEANILEAKEWCEEKFKNADIKERRIPRHYIKDVCSVTKGEKETEEQKELRLGTSLNNFKRSNIFEKVQRKEKLTEDEQRIFEEYKDLIEQYEISKDENDKIEKANGIIKRNELKEIRKHEISEIKLQKMYSNILKVREWCEKKYAGLPIYKRRLPRKTICNTKNSELNLNDREEVSLGMTLFIFRKSELYQKAKNKESLTDKELEIYNEYKKLIDEYDITKYEANILETKEWCEEKYKNQPIYKRRFPRKRIKGVTCSQNRELETEEQREVRLGCAIAAFKASKIYKKAIKGEALNKVEERIYDEFKELQSEYFISIHEANLLETIEWCEKKFKDQPVNKRRLPRVVIDGILAAEKGEKETEEQKEIRLGSFLQRFKNTAMYQKYIDGCELSNEEQRILNIYKQLIEKYSENKEYYILNKYYNNILETRKWCEEKFKNKPLCERRFPRRIEGVIAVKNGEEENEEQREARLGSAIYRFKRTNLYKKAEKGERLTEFEQKIYDEYKQLEYDYTLIFIRK